MSLYAIQLYDLAMLHREKCFWWGTEGNTNNYEVNKCGNHFR